MRIDDVDPGREEGLACSERKQLVELHRRNWFLELEFEILTLACAYFAREHILAEQRYGWSTNEPPRLSLGR
jgi:hypothetical protein